MHRIIPLLAALLVTPGCILAIDADRHDDDPWWVHGDDDDDDDGWYDTADRPDTDVEPMPTADVTIGLDVDTVQAGAITLILGTMTGEAGPADVTAIAFEDGIDILEYAPTGGDGFALVVSAHADADGAYDLGVLFGEIGTAIVEDAVFVEAAAADSDDDSEACPK